MNPITITPATKVAITVERCEGAPISVTPVSAIPITIEGVPGIPGPPGPPGTAHGFLFSQDTPSALWVVEHGLQAEPIVAVKDSAGSVVITEIRHVAQGVTHIVFEFPTSGRARLI